MTATGRNSLPPSSAARRYDAPACVVELLEDAREE
jgi:hypothetical protein